MLSNFHTHTVFCDGEHTPEQVVQAALERGFSAIGFSGHATTPFDLRYCMQDTDGYIACIRSLQQRYGKDIEIYLGTEEDAFAPVDRSQYDYIIGSCHYVCADGIYYPVDSGRDYMERIMERFDHDPVRAAQAYYEFFCTYILDRRPDIIGHFDLITKYDEAGQPCFLHSPAYRALALDFLRRAAASGCIFEVNMGAMARGLRTAPYPSVELLHELKRLDARIILSSDSHHIDTLTFGFDEVRQLLREIGFRQTCTLSHGAFVTQLL
jgi:histidinol-phosphatase (PHP family)